MEPEKRLEERLRMGRLYDRYGALLTPKQREACDLVLLQDWSLAEAASALGVTRQGIHDLIQRSREHLEEAEAALGFLKERQKLHRALADLVGRHREELPEPFVRELFVLIEPEEGDSADV
ncbi:putative helix-turn-helix protein YlxM/p13 family protein [Aminomonas paucivorans DSM 12260]|uniref:UPF0122 protein Apau_0771 n=1 Tax=Aminomonas paucivorans DSM 12260 TaxID=584708 RepID=E3CVE3_9BACT|nr:sigma factor-like helix-turn-helix DNA-binding protein [Aminomonas paucivorans]EFQ23199.1 putative helix-turn-helix protein YlxM/p13 family protein [Aminomonas paucivorans DSM 12260]